MASANEPSVIVPLEYLWSIDAQNYFNFYDGITQKLTSPEFGNDQYRFLLHLDYDDQFFEELLYLELVRCSNDTQDIELQYKLSTDRDSVTCRMLSRV